MAVSSLFLASIAITGIPALLGSALILGIVHLNVMTFKVLSKALKNIIIGAIGMIIMSVSLLLFGGALEKIINATRDVSFEQVAIIASLTILLGGAVAALGIPAVFPFILLGSISMAIMGFALRPFADTLAVLATATEKMEMRHILLVAGAMTTLALGISALSILLIPVILGNLTLNVMLPPIRKFVDIIKTVNEIEGNPLTKVRQLLSCMSAITNFYQSQGLGFFAAIKAARNASRIKGYISNFAHAVKALEPLKDMQEVNTKAIHSIVEAVSDITWFFATVQFSKNIEAKSEFTKYVVDHFTTMALDIQDKFNNIREINHKAVKSITDTCRSIIYYYTFTLFVPKRQKVLDMNDCVKLFTDNAKHLKSITQGFTNGDYDKISLMLKSMDEVMNFLKHS